MLIEFPLADTLPERATLARQRLSHLEFSELVLGDEAARRERLAESRATAAYLDPGMVLNAGDPEAAVRFDQGLWTELGAGRSIDDASAICCSP